VESVSIEAFEFMLYIIAGMIGFVLIRVWRIPSIEEKLTNVVRDTDRNRQHIHNIHQTLSHHETRMTILEKAKAETSQSKTTPKDPPCDCEGS